MSADSFHHNVEQALKKMGKVYDFVSAIKSARKNVEVKVMGAMDFYKWKDFTSKHKLNNDPERTYMCDIVQVPCASSVTQERRPPHRVDPERLLTANLTCCRRSVVGHRHRPREFDLVGRVVVNRHDGKIRKMRGGEI
ncbi:hypothetical protein J6590_047603 [Homalodisca vitripennis]|nr:hypothetical protein J6590_047603 [Homalodisca vitripennis]